LDIGRDYSLMIEYSTFSELKKWSKERIPQFSIP